MSLRVFLVEDSKLIRERLEEGLSSAGGISIVGTADNEMAALAGLHESGCDAVILDLQLKKGNGLGVLRSLRADPVSSRPVVIVFTNFATPRYRDISLRCGADYFFDKSRDYDQVCQVLEDLAGATPAPGSALLH